MHLNLLSDKDEERSLFNAAGNVMCARKRNWNVDIASLMVQE